MPYLEPDQISNWHAHVYFDGTSRDAASAFRQAIVERFGATIEMGRFHERPVGPHPMWSYQITIAPAQFAEVVGWLALNHGALDVFVHPNTGKQVRDHRDSAIWLGRSYKLVLEALPPD